MSTWSLILWAAGCFGFSFAVAHFTERVLLSVVWKTRHRAQGRDAATSDRDTTSSIERATAHVSSEQIGHVDAPALSDARPEEVKDQSGAGQPQTRMPRRHPAPARRGLERSAQAALRLRARYHHGRSRHPAHRQRP